MGTGCCESKIMVLPCSGAADVGEIADRATVQVRQKEYGDMFCLASSGADVSGFMVSVQGAGTVVNQRRVPDGERSGDGQNLWRETDDVRGGRIPVGNREGAGDCRVRLYDSCRPT